MKADMPLNKETKPYMKVVQKVLSLGQILDLSCTSHLCRGLTYTEIKT